MNPDDILDLGKNMGTILAGVFYVAIVFWTYKDSRKRIDDPILIATSTAVSMLPLVGVLVYMLLRPSEYLADVRERELEIRMMERQLGRQERCPYCKSHIEGDYLSCPVCTTKLRQSCVGCEKPLDPRWVMCPHCETEVPGRSRPGPGGGEPRRSSTPPRERSTSSDRSPSRDSRPAPRREDKPSTKTKAKAEPKAKAKSSAAKSDKAEGDIRTEPFGPGDRSSSDTTLI